MNVYEISVYVILLSFFAGIILTAAVEKTVNFIKRKVKSKWMR